MEEERRCDHRSGERFKDAPLLVLKMEEGATSRRMQL